MGYISKKQREEIRLKYGGLCAYSGTPLEKDWQIDHVKPIIRNWWTNTTMFPNDDVIDNMVPCQKIINHYKGNLNLQEFRNWFMAGLHTRLAKLPKNPRTVKSQKKIEYLHKVASYFNIAENKPFDGIFYFERVEKLFIKTDLTDELSNEEQN